MDSVLRKQNSLGIWFPQNLGYFRISQAEEEGSGEESSACSIRFLLAKFGADRNTNTSYHKIVSVIYLAMCSSKSKGDAPSASASGISAMATRAEVPLCRQSLRFLGRGSFLSPGRDYTLGLPRVFCPRHPHSTLCILEYVVSLSLLNFCEIYNFGAHPLAMDAHSGNARGGIQMRLTHPPIRAQARSQRRKGGASRTPYF